MDPEKMRDEAERHESIGFSARAREMREAADEIERLRKALAAELADRTEIAKNGLKQWNGVTEEFVFTDAIWRRKDPEGFAIAQQSRAALASSEGAGEEPDTDWQPGIDCKHGYDACPICDRPIHSPTSAAEDREDG